jgi:anaerobic selenocysteine-containing dehydrogenase
MVVAPGAIPAAILEGRPYPVKAWILQAGNPLMALGDAKKLHAAMMSDNLELSVNMDHWITPCGALADYLLPASDGIERPLLSNMWGFGDSFSASRRLIEPLYERRDDYQLWRELGNRLGQQGMWPDTMEEWFDDILAPTGLTHGELADRAVPWLMAEPQHRRYESRGFATASGKVELSSALLESLGYPPIPEVEEPAWSPIASPDIHAEFPLVLTTGNSLKWYYRSQHKHLEKMRRQHPYALATLHPETAAALGIADGDMVHVETPLGRVQQKAKLDPGMHPRVVHADSHMWYPEREAEGDAHYGVWESNINAILPDGEAFADYAGDNYMRGLLCRVTPVAASAPD